jgi:hypothetical protein
MPPKRASAAVTALQGLDRHALPRLSARALCSIVDIESERQKGKT